MSQQIFEKINKLLKKQNANYRIVKHEPAGTSLSVAKVRGTQIGQGAKALVCVVKGNGVKKYVLAVLPADYKANLNNIAIKFQGSKASLVSPAEVLKLTDCVIGCVAPFSFHEELTLIADPKLFERYEEIAFNAGLLECSIILNAKDYKRITKPMLVNFATDN